MPHLPLATSFAHSAPEPVRASCGKRAPVKDRQQGTGTGAPGSSAGASCPREVRKFPFSVSGKKKRTANGTLSALGSRSSGSSFTSRSKAAAVSCCASSALPRGALGPTGGFSTGGLSAARECGEASLGARRGDLRRADGCEDVVMPIPLGCLSHTARSSETDNAAVVGTLRDTAPRVHNTGGHNTRHPSTAARGTPTQSLG